jgi:uncharacterized protein
MKTTFPEKSKPHEENIRKIADIVVKVGGSKIASIILFGSFARGTWVFDRYSEDNAVYEYASDYDFLIIKKSKYKDEKEQISDFDLERKIKREIELATIVRDSHNPHFVIEPLDYVNSELEKGRYFFSDIKKEGILLYDSEEFKLAQPLVLSEKEAREIAREDYEHWFGNVETRLEDFYSNLKKADQGQKYLSKAAFELHQAAENLYNCALLVLTGYKPKTHDLVQLSKLASAQSNKFLTIFPTATQNQKDCLELLQKSYIEARYSKHFKITKEQLEYLIERVEKLKGLVGEVCKEKI